MALGDFARRILGAPTTSPSAPLANGADTGLHQSAQVDTGSVTDAGRGDDLSTANAIDQEENDSPRILGAFRSAKEHAVELRAMLNGYSIEGRSLYAGDLAHLHQVMCQQRGWIWRRWPAVGREFKKLDGVRKGKVWLNGERLTFYEIGPLPGVASNVVPHAAVERKREARS